jgi:hypothetical protein
MAYIKPTMREEDEFNGSGKRPMVLDIIHPDGVTSLLGDMRMVLHVPPSGLKFDYSKNVAYTQTLGGFIETYWGDSPISLSLDLVTGGFVRIGTGLVSTTGPVTTRQNDTFGLDLRGTRRDTIAYDKFLDLLALFHNNGSVYDSRGNVVVQGRIKIRFDGSEWYGWFTTFSVSEDTDKPYMFSLSAGFQIERETHGIRTQHGNLFDRNNRRKS